MDKDAAKLPITRTEKVLDKGAIVAAFEPTIGGAISSVLSGMSQSRKFNRIAGVLHDLSEDLAGLRSEVVDEYVRTEDFEELLEQTLRHAAEERNDGVRALYRRFLFHAITSPGDEYDDQIRILRALERMRPPHLAILKALAQPPGPSAHPKYMGSPIQTIRERTGLGEEEIKLGVGALNEIGATNLQSLMVMMTGHGSEALEGTITDFGRQLLAYIEDREEIGEA